MTKISAGAHGDFTLKQLAGIAFAASLRVREARSMMVVLDGSGFESFEDLGEDQQKALFSVLTRTLYEAEKAATQLQHVLELAEVALEDAMARNPVTLTEMEDAAVSEPEGHLGAARDYFLGKKEAQS